MHDDDDRVTHKPYNPIKTVDRWEETVKLKKQVMDLHVAVDVWGA